VLHTRLNATFFRSVVRFATLGSVVALLPATARAAELPAEDRQFVDQTVAQVMQQGRIPGAMVSVTGPRGSYTKSYGVGELASGAPIRLDDHIRIASITKTYTATAVLQQVDRGRLKLSDTIDGWVKRIPNGGKITIRQLLAMRSGLADYTSDPAFTDVVNANPRAPFGPRDVLRILRRSKPQLAPGKRTVYTDANYVLLGIILEKVTGRSVESLIERGIARPLGLRETSFPTGQSLPSPFAHGYYAGDDGQGEIRDYTLINPGLAWTAGGMVSTLADLRTWSKALATGKLLSKRMHAARMRFGEIPNQGGPSLGYGLGIMHIGDWVGHDGAIFGYSSVTMYLPRVGARIAVAANLSSNFSAAAVQMFAPIAGRLYPRSGI
jgi:D-alanyl-D-alanine carboxypeptidase